MTTTQPELTLDLDGGFADLQAAFSRMDREDRDGWESNVIRQAIEYVAKQGDSFTSDDVRGLPGFPKVHPNRIGQAFNQAVRTGYLVEIGRRPSRIRQAHGRKVGVYLLASLHRP